MVLKPSFRFRVDVFVVSFKLRELGKEGLAFILVLTLHIFLI